MATTKKPATKKAPAKKPASKKPAIKKSVASKATSKKTTKAVNAAQLRSFRVAPAPVPFKTFKITKQTIYWIILIAFIVIAQLWIIKLQVEVATLLEAQQAQLIENM
jgi:hypothetical protein